MPTARSDTLRDIQLSLPMQLLQTREAAMARFRPMLRRHALTEQQWRVIRVLAAQSDLDAGELAARATLLAPSLTRILRTLERQQFIERSADAADQRRSLIALTPAGRRKYRTVGRDSEALYREIESAFGTPRLRQLYALLAELNVALGAPDTPEKPC